MSIDYSFRTIPRSSIIGGEVSKPVSFNDFPLLMSARNRILFCRRDRSPPRHLQLCLLGSSHVYLSEETTARLLLHGCRSTVVPGEWVGEFAPPGFPRNV